MNVSDFRRVAAQGNAQVLLDSKTGELKVRPQTAFHRAVDWIRERLAPNPHAAAERDAAHNRFLRAIADDSGYSRQDVSQAQAMLSADLIERRPLSSRRIREVIGELDANSTPAMRENRAALARVSSRAIESGLPPGIDGEERELLARRVEEEVRRAGGDGLRPVTFAKASELTNGIVDAFLAEQPAAAEAPATAAQAAGGASPAPPAADVVASAERRGESVAAAPAPAAAVATPSAAPLSVPSGGPAAAEPGPPPRVSKKELLRALNKAKLPGGLRLELRRQVKAGGILDQGGLVRRANARTAQWVVENRVGRWYGEAQQALGRRGKIKHGEMLSVPSSMLREVTHLISNGDAILAYPEVKKRARSLIAAHVQLELQSGEGT